MPDPVRSSFPLFGTWVTAAVVSVSVHGLFLGACACALHAFRAEVTETVELDLGGLDLSVSEQEDDAQAACVETASAPSAALERTESRDEPETSVREAEPLPPEDEPPPEPKTADVSEQIPTSAPPTPDLETPPPQATTQTTIPTPSGAPAPKEAPPVATDVPPPAHNSPFTQETRPMPPPQLLQSASVPAVPAPVQARVDVPAKPRSAIRPKYPKSARERGAEGSVSLLLDVAADGSVHGVFVTTSSGHADLDDAAVAETKRAKFTPAKRDGRSVPSTAQITLQFKLRK